VGIKSKLYSKMATRAQKQTVWAPWLQNLGEMLEPHLAEIKHQGESELTPWAPSSWKASPCHIKLRKQEGFRHPQTPAPNLRGRWLADQTGEHLASRGISPATLGINQHRPLGRLTLPHPCKKKKTWTINKELKTNTQQRGRAAESTPEKGGGAMS
jgi:hypothetical protein